jgi:uncharacterized protein DUF3606
MPTRTVISSKPPTAADWRWLDRQAINVADHEQMALLSHLFHTSTNRIHAAVDAVGPKIRDVRRHLQENPGKPGRPFRRRSR